MIIAFNLIIIFIFLVYVINSYYLSIRQNIIKVSSFLFRLIISWVLAKNIASLLIKINISNDKYEYIINGQVIYNIVDILKVLIIKNFPELTYIINERIATIYIIESISIMIIRTILLIIIYILVAIIYRLIMLLIKKIKKKEQVKPEEVISKKRGLIFGIVQGLIVVFLISIPFSGISSLTNDILRLEETIELSKEVSFIKDYRNTITGKIFKTFNVNRKPIDVYFFDEVFAIELNDSKVLISDEVRAFVDIIEIIESKNFNEINKGIEEKIDLEFIEKLNKKLNKVKSLNTTAPLLIDYFLVSELEIKLEDKLYNVNYYNEISYISNLLILYLKEKDNIYLEDLLDNDPELIYSILNNLSKLESLDILSSDISNELLKNEFVMNYLKELELDRINLSNVNYHKEVSILKDLFNVAYNIEDDFIEDEVEEITLLIASSNILMDNDEIFLEYLIQNHLYDYRLTIKRLPINAQDIRSFILISKAYIDNGYFESYFRFSKLYDEETIEILIGAITSSDILRNNLTTIIKLFLKESMLEIDVPLTIPGEIDFKSEEGKNELRELLRLFQIMNYGINQKNLEKHLDEICNILENSDVIKANIDNIIGWGLSKYNTTSYDIYIANIDYNSPEGKSEIKKLVKIFRLLVNRKVFDTDLSGLLKLSKEELDTIFSSKLIEEASIHLIYDMGKDDKIPIVVNFELDDPAWYKSSRNNGELRNFVYAMKIIFKDVKSLDDIKFTPELILSIDDGTIDTNGDGVVDDKDENELKEIMRSKILSDSIIKFIYDYYKNQNK